MLFLLSWHTANLPRRPIQDYMNELIEKIQRRIEERKFCTIFEKDVSVYWPHEDTGREKQKEAIQAFAREHGWRATILDPGIRVTFRKAA